MHYSDEQWEQLIAQSDASGLSGKQWCLENNISYGAYRYHKYSKGNNNNSNAVKADHKLVKVKVVDDNTDTTNNDFSITIGKASIKVDSVASLNNIAKLITLINET